MSHLILAAVAAATAGWFLNFLSYRVIKERTLRERRWDYNICCGVTDGGGVNADITRHAPVPRFELIEDVTALPHADGAFEQVLCSHTLEHVDDPRAMFAELRRVGRQVTILVPPLWDPFGALNPLEHRVIFLTLATRHVDRLPRYVPYRPARWLQALWGQRIRGRVPGAVVIRRLRRLWLRWSRSRVLSRHSPDARRSPTRSAQGRP